MEDVKPGTKLIDGDSGVEAIVVRGPVGSGVAVVASTTDKVLLGKRYVCETCLAEVVATHAGAAVFQCHEGSMVVKAAKPLPSSD